MEKGSQPVIIIKKKKGHGSGHHGGSWKVALADFMTAMMAFFLLLWLLEIATPAEKAAIAGYFQNPGNEYIIGPGGADSAVIDMAPQSKEADPNTDLSEDDLRKRLEQLEQEQLDQLKLQLEEEINNLDSVFQKLKDQILIDFTALGLRIQIVDKERRPMFDIGSAHLKDYSTDVLHALAPIINNVPNKASINGHTDTIPYSAGAVYTNWELSADRANSARRALLAGGYPEAKVVTVQGMGARAPLLEDNPAAPVNRRIAIIILKKAVSDAMAAGGVGLLSSDLVPNPPPSSSAIQAAQRIMSEEEIDKAIDAADKSKQ